jgi:hypothetical protein
MLYVNHFIFSCFSQALKIACELKAKLSVFLRQKNNVARTLLPFGRVVKRFFLSAGYPAGFPNKKGRDGNRRGPVVLS